jgi:hypothetical protein
MANKVVTPAATVNTQIDNNGLNPASTQNRGVAHITLQYEGVTLTPDDIYDMLDTQYAVVASPKSTMSRNTWIFNIGPA